MAFLLGECKSLSFFFFFFFKLGGDRSMPGQSGPGHVMNRGGMSG